MTNDFAAVAAIMTNDWRHIDLQSFVIGHRVSDALICHPPPKALKRPDAPPLQEPTLNAQRRTLNLMAMTNDFAAARLS